MPLLEPARYKAAWGGRGSGKSHFFAELLIEDSLAEKGMRSVCIREVQKSLKESAKRLIEDKLAALNLGDADGFKIFREVVVTPGDGIITFHGMQDHTAESIKSLEGFGRAWVEEAQTLSARSLSLLRPTIRAEGSELWFSWNPRRRNDPVDAMFRSGVPPTGAAIVRANWSDNPWFPLVLNQERLDCLRDNPDQYDHIWEGGYVTVAAGAYYAKHLAETKAQGRIGRVAPDPLMTIRAYWDIGGTGAKADATAIWICQFVGREIRVLNYYEAQGQPLATHLNWLREHKYSKALCVLPHDGASNEKILDVSYQSAIEEAGFDVEVIPNQGRGAAAMRIEASRRLFPSIWFNAETTEAGREALGWYHERKDETRNIGLGPEHDWCLAAGTQVLTPGGWCKVEDIQVHNEVMTPRGPRRVLRSGIVRMTSEWANVKGIICTPEHRFFTSRGLVEAGELSSQDRLWTRGALGLSILAFLSATFRLGLKTAIISATPEGKRRTVAQSSFIVWFMRLCMVKSRRAMKSIMSMATRSITIPRTSQPCLALNTAAATNQSHAMPAFAESAVRNSVAIRNSGRDAAWNASEPIMLGSNENAAPAFNLTVDIDECYFVRGDDGSSYLVSNSSHGADAFGLMCVAYEAPQQKRKPSSVSVGWMG